MWNDSTNKSKHVMINNNKQDKKKLFTNVSCAKSQSFTIRNWIELIYKIITKNEAIFFKKANNSCKNTYKRTNRKLIVKCVWTKWKLLVSIVDQFEQRSINSHLSIVFSNTQQQFFFNKNISKLHNREQKKKNVVGFMIDTQTVLQNQELWMRTRPLFSSFLGVFHSLPCSI